MTFHGTLLSLKKEKKLECHWLQILLDASKVMFSFYRLGTTTKLFTINPKDRSVIELYGILDPITRDWTDGLLSNIFRDINKPTDKNEKKYIVYDGDVDALWVENMNSVMDDNKLLTLANGERIRLQKHCAMLFEVSRDVLGIWPRAYKTQHENFSAQHKNFSANIHENANYYWHFHILLLAEKI